MNGWPHITTIAQQAPSLLEDISKGFTSEGPSIPIQPLAYVMLLAGLVGLCWYGWRRWKLYTSYPGRVMILGLSSRFGITFEQRWWLERVASKAGLESPVTLLMGPATLEHYLKEYLTQAWPWAAKRAQSELQSLSEALFQDMDEAEGEGDGEGDPSAAG